MGFEGFKLLEHLQETPRPSWQLPACLEDFLFWGSFRNDTVTMNKGRYSRSAGWWELSDSIFPYISCKEKNPQNIEAQLKPPVTHLSASLRISSSSDYIWVGRENTKFQWCSCSPMFCETWSERGVFRDSDKEEKSTENSRQNVGKNYPQRKCHSISQNTDPHGTWWLSFGQLKGLKASRLTGGSITKALPLEENKYGSVGNSGKWPVKRKEGRKWQILHKRGKLPTSPSPSSIKYQ